jgi:hypothetical protein
MLYPLSYERRWTSDSVRHPRVGVSGHVADQGVRTGAKATWCVRGV